MSNGRENSAWLRLLIADRRKAIEERGFAGGPTGHELGEIEMMEALADKLDHGDESEVVEQPSSNAEQPPTGIKCPSHYCAPFNPDLKVTDIIDGWALNFWLGSVVKYILRAGENRRESRLSDLRKAQVCLQREIDAEEQFMDIAKAEVD